MQKNNYRYLIYIILVIYSVITFVPNSFANQSENHNILTHFKTNHKEIALTFDACDNGIDWKLINFLKKNNIHATFFWTGKWIRNNKDIAKEMSHNKLFDIQIHGNMHKPCILNNKSAYGIKGHKNAQEAADEIQFGADEIKNISNNKLLFYRSGTATYDEKCIEIVHNLGYKVAGYSVLGDAGASYSAIQVQKALLNVTNGDIVIMHMNKPKSGTADGVISAIPILIKQGFSFILLKNVDVII